MTFIQLVELKETELKGTVISIRVTGHNEIESHGFSDGMAKCTFDDADNIKAIEILIDSSLPDVIKSKVLLHELGHSFDYLKRLDALKNVRSKQKEIAAFNRESEYFAFEHSLQEAKKLFSQGQQDILKSLIEGITNRSMHNDTTYKQPIADIMKSDLWKDCFELSRESLSLMDDALKYFLEEKNISKDVFDKIMYISIKYILYQKGRKLDLYDLIIGEDLNIKLLNVVSGKDEFINLFHKRTLLILRNYLITFLENLNSEKLKLDELYQLATNNKGLEFEQAILPVINLNKGIIEQSLRDFDNERKLSFIPDSARYCPVCQERPCMCSDPDPG